MFESFDVAVPSMTVSSVFELDLSSVDVSGCYLCASTSDLEETLILCRPKDARLQDSELSFEVSETDNQGVFEVTVSCENPAFNVVLDAGSVKGRFEDNCFTLNGRRTIRFYCDDDISLKEYTGELKVYDLYSMCEY